MKKILYLALVLVIFLLLYPIPNNRPTYSKTLLDNAGNLLCANVSSEQQWHLPLDEDIPEILGKAIMLYEDEYFYYHAGINPISVIKSVLINSKAGKVKRGASTITMQVMRLRNRSANRSVKTKIFESIGAIKYSLIKRKSGVLREWCDIAPFGGNTIGIKTAAFRYFNRPLDQLSYGEMALLAVLPNTPTSVNLSKNRSILISRRNTLLQKMADRKVISEDELTLSMGEDLPSQPNKVPSEAQHLLSYLIKKYPNKNQFITTLDGSLQNRLTQLVNEESNYLQREDINNLAAMVVDIERDEIVAYVGNTIQQNKGFSYVDIIQSPRSYGSLLKPLLYALALEEGSFLPNEFIADIPTNYGEFRPENFDKKFRGIVPLGDLVTQSLNVPSVRLLHELGQNKFYKLIQDLQIKHLNRGVDHYGLSIILGGGETTLWEISRIYKGLAQNYLGMNKPYKDMKVLKDEKVVNSSTFTFSTYSLQHLFNTMTNLSRPREEKSWQLFGYNHKVAWKTGTSYGHKDAWAAGFNKKYQVTVWVGNEIGEGRKDLTGIVRAAPILFKIFNILPQNEWFTTKAPYATNTVITTCKETGLLKGNLCKHITSLRVHKISHALKTCDFHEINLIGDTLLKFHPLIEYYYAVANPQYQKNIPNNTRLKIIYPYKGLKIFLPKTTDSSKNSFLAQANIKNTYLHWYLDDIYIATTENAQLLIQSHAGYHRLLIIDEDGNRDECTFEIIEN
ncbi:MAG TPA: penicillin-binding protein 1C [Saprospiraceae bacterium]|nr:penicillin-binding protein 1C [Saprospiraceae bacterium]